MGGAFLCATRSIYPIGGMAATARAIRLEAPSLLATVNQSLGARFVLPSSHVLQCGNGRGFAKKAIGLEP